MECMDQYNNLEANVTNLVPYNDFVNCARVALGKNLWIRGLCLLCTQELLDVTILGNFGVSK